MKKIAAIILLLSINVTAGNLVKSPWVITKIETKQQVVFLTFDLCPRIGPDQFDKVLYDFLVAEKLPAVFFASGSWMVRNYRWMKDVFNHKHFYFAGHGWEHRNMRDLNPTEIKEINHLTAEYIKFLTGNYPYIFRPPFAHLTRNIVEGAELSNQFIIHYTVESGDPSVGSKSMIKELKNPENGSIIIFHLNGRGKHTLKALKVLLPIWKEKGFEIGYLPDYVEPISYKREPMTLSH